MRFAICLLMTLALFWQAIFALPVARGNLAVDATLGVRHIPRAAVDSIPYVGQGHAQAKRALGVIGKGAMAIWRKISGKSKMPADERKFRKAAKADRQKWKPQVEKMRKMNAANAKAKVVPR